MRVPRLNFEDLPDRIPLEQRPDFFLGLEDQLLIGSAMFSEWTTFISEQTHMAFCSGANLATLLTAQAAMEVHLRWEFCPELPNAGFAELIEKSGLDDDLKAVLHEIRKYRNKWVHVREPEDDGHLLTDPDAAREEVERMAIRAVAAHLEVMFLIQGT